MLKNIQQKLLRYSKVAGVEIVLLPEGNYTINFTVLNLKNNLVVVERNETGIHSFEKIFSFIGPDIPLSVSILGRGIINKNVPFLNGENETEILQQVLPNAKPTEFFVQKIDSDNSSFISVIRVETITPVLEKLKAKGSYVVNVFLGPFSVMNILEVIQQQEPNLSFAGHSFELSKNKLFEYKVVNDHSTKDFRIGDEKIPEKNLISFASAFSLIKEGDVKGLTNDLIKSDREEFHSRKIFRTMAFSVLVFLFVALLINYLLFTGYQKENDHLNAQSTLYSGLVAEVENMETVVKEKESFLKSAGWLTTSKSSYYADQLAAELPSSIRLTELRVNPYNEKLSKSAKKLYFKTDTISIVGTCVNPTVLNPWMEKLKSLHWVNSVRNTGYTYDSKNKVGNFMLELTVNNE